MQQQEGVLKGNILKRYNGRMNISQKLFDNRVVIDVNLSANNTVNQRPDITGLIGGSISSNPTIPAYDEAGKPYQFENGINPLTVLDLEKDITTINRILGNVSGAVTIVKGLVPNIRCRLNRICGNHKEQNFVGHLSEVIYRSAQGSIQYFEIYTDISLPGYFPLKIWICHP